ncbi:hypothetical protein M422DRAFT_277368 [Sphaerobolus stellatus SS14]|uniref:SMP-30/Gluconolactonase/LRE-like region domain-containing protein n=1 Tax=Sphaerobolus stellatus (strain SS14) TaxID=990650 RepID=A0A0C9UAU7_SPHS4|nr:hypothetical protein M422DRAFT_277368 [Sphaerobolus stellatus SS14]
MVTVQLPNQAYRIDPKTREVHVVADGFEIPNGIAFSLDGSIAYAYVNRTVLTRRECQQVFYQRINIYHKFLKCKFKYCENIPSRRQKMEIYVVAIRKVIACSIMTA